MKKANGEITTVLKPQKLLAGPKYVEYVSIPEETDMSRSNKAAELITAYKIYRAV